MAQYDISNTTTTDMESEVKDYSVSSQILDEAGVNKESIWDSKNWSEYLGYYKSIPELKKAVDALAAWTVGKGYKGDVETEVTLDIINGWGEDSFQSIMQNMLTVKKINGDAFAQIIRNEGRLINLKPLNPRNVRIVVDDKGIIIRYDLLNNKGIPIKPIQTQDMFHICNDRIGNEIHGVSVVEACKWVINARNEAMSDWRRILHRNLAGVRIIEVDEDDDEQIEILSARWAKAIDKGEVLILPKGTASPINTAPPVSPENWIRYLENFFYQAVGIPKIILGGSQEFTEASSKIGYLTFEQVYMTEQRLLEQDLWNQLAIKIKFERPVSLKDNIVEDEEKNTGQVGVQPNETQAQVGRNE